ncbi:MAG: tetratricopeptide repeat protein [Pseudomonadota bacterium]
MMKKQSNFTVKRFLRLLFCLACFLYFEVVHGLNNNNEYLEILIKHDTSALDLSIGMLQNSISSDNVDSEDQYVKAINLLSKSLDKDRLEFIDKWILSGKESYFPYLLKGLYFAEKGWKSRGRSYSNKTADKQFKQMLADFTIAESMLLTAIELNPNAINAYSELIAIYSSHKQYAGKARIIHDKGVAYNKNSIEIRIRYLAFLFPKWHADMELRANYITKIASQANQNLFMLEVLIENYIQMAEHIKDYKKSMDLYSVAFKQGYRCRTHVSRALRIFNFKYYTYALDDLNELIKRCPDNSSAYLIKARALYKLGDFDASMKNFDLALSLNPGAPHIIGTRGYIQYREKNYEKAISDLTNAIEKDNGTAWMWVNRAKAYKKLKQYDKAIYDFQHAIQLKPGKTSSYRLMGYCYTKLQQYGLALKAYNSGLLIDENNAKLLIKRAQLNSNVFEDNQSAINDLEYLIKLEPTNKKAMKLLYDIKLNNT